MSVWIIMGITIIMLIIPMYTPKRSLGILPTTIKYGTPIILAQATPKPVMGAKSRYLFSMVGKINRPIPAMIRQAKCTHLGLYFFVSHTRPNAERNVTILYQPLTRPVQATASSYKDLLTSLEVFQTDFAILWEQYCQ